MKYIFYIILLLKVFAIQAQGTIETAFIEHLVNKGDYREAIFLIDKDKFTLKGTKADSVYYLKGWSHYSLMQLEKSSKALLKVSAESQFYYKARFFAAYNQAHLKNYQQATEIINLTATDERLYTNLKAFQLSGIDLLNKNYLSASERLCEIDSMLSPLYDPLKNLKLIQLELQKHKTKSPVFASILSSFIPGAGKFYMGRKGEGISTFIGTVGLGLITWENYRKLGLKNIKTLFFGSLFAANYVSNIYGSAVAAKVVENDYQNVMQNQILFNLHIPLRNIFE